MIRALSGFQVRDQEALTRVIQKNHLTIHRVTRRGPRFLVAEVDYAGHPAIWKMCVQSNAVDQWSGKKFAREIRFLDFLRTGTHRTARDFAPRILASAVGARPWYIREHITGHDYSYTGNIRFRPTFFTPDRLRAILKNFHDLQSITPAELPKPFRSSLHRYDTIDHWLSFLQPFWGNIGATLNDPAAGNILQAWLIARRPVYARLPVALAHQEPYAPHFFQVAGHLRLIDWENINWANPASDGTILWMRADGHPSWQASLYRGWKKNWAHLGDGFDMAWETDLLVRSVYTLLSAKTYPDQADIRPLARVATRVIQQVLKGSQR